MSVSVFRDLSNMGNLYVKFEKDYDGVDSRTISNEILEQYEGSVWIPPDPEPVHDVDETILVTRQRVYDFLMFFIGEESFDDEEVYQLRRLRTRVVASNVVVNVKKNIIEISEKHARLLHVKYKIKFRFV